MYPNLSEGADSAGGQMREDKECPFTGVTNSSGRVLEEGAGRRCSERGVDYAFKSGVSFLLLTLSRVTDGEDMGRELWTMPWYPALSIVTDGEDRGENRGLCLGIRR